MYRAAIIVLMVLFISSHLLFAQEPEYFELTAQLKKALTEYESQGYSGAVLVRYKGKVLVKDGFGLAHKKRNQKNEAETVFDTGSLSKQFTAAAILKLQMKKLLKVEDKISKYFKNVVPEDKKDITVHQLLTHTSGFKRLIYYKDALGDPLNMMDRQVMVNHAMSTLLNGKPGKKHEYANTNYYLLAAIVEIASETDFASYVIKEIFEPAGMDRTGFTKMPFDKNDKEEETAHRYNADNTDMGSQVAWEFNWGYKGAAGVVSTVGDLEKYHDALYNETILDKEHLALFTTADTSVANNVYAYGWYVMHSSKNTPKVMHSGDAVGAHSIMAMFPEDDIVIVVLCNQSIEGNVSWAWKVSNKIEALLFAETKD